MPQLEKIETTLSQFMLQRQPAVHEVPCDVVKILRCIHENPFDPDLSVKRLKSRCQVRDNNVSSRFRHEVGITIKDYIEDLRMEAAGLLLREKQIGIFEVAQLTGYYNPQTFYSAFQKHFHCTPGAYRRSVDGRGR